MAKGGILCSNCLKLPGAHWVGISALDGSDVWSCHLCLHYFIEREIFLKYGKEPPYDLRI